MSTSLDSHDARTALGSLTQESSTEPAPRLDKMPVGPTQMMHKTSRTTCTDFWSLPHTQEECDSINRLFINRFKAMYGLRANGTPRGTMTPKPLTASTEIHGPVPWHHMPNPSHHRRVDKAESIPASPFYLKLASGAIAGILGTCLIFPLDLIKTRLQNQQGNSLYKSGLDCARAVFRADGLRGFYRGLLPNILGVTPEKAIKLAVNDSMRALLARQHRCLDAELPILHGMLAGAVAGLCQVVATNPMEIVKINMQVATTHSHGPGLAHPAVHPHPVGLVAMVRRLGLRGLYFGMSATLCRFDVALHELAVLHALFSMSLSRDIPFSVIFFSSFSLLKQHLGQLFEGPRIESRGPVPLPLVFVAGLMAGTLGSFLVTPMDVVKTRLQVLDPFSHSGLKEAVKLRHVYRTIYLTEGLGAFFKGAVQRCCIISPLFGVSLLAYEFQQRLFSHVHV